MEDRNSNFIELRWNALRQLHQITDSTGRLLGLRYDTAARLAEVSIVTPAPDSPEYSFATNTTLPGNWSKYGIELTSWCVDLITTQTI